MKMYIKTIETAYAVNNSSAKSIVKNLFANDYNGNIKLVYDSDDLNGIYNSKIFYSGKESSFVDVTTVRFNCSTVFIEDIKDMEEKLFNVLFSGLKFTLAISTINLFGKSILLENGLYIYRLEESNRHYLNPEIERHLEFTLIKERLKVINNSSYNFYYKVNSRYTIVRLLNEYNLIAKFGNFKSMKKIPNGFFIAKDYYLSLFNNYKPCYYYTAYRTGNRLAIMIPR